MACPPQAAPHVCTPNPDHSVHLSAEPWLLLRGRGGQVRGLFFLASSASKIPVKIFLLLLVASPLNWPFGPRPATRSGQFLLALLAQCTKSLLVNREPRVWVLEREGVWGRFGHTLDNSDNQRQEREKVGRLLPLPREEAATHTPRTGSL